MPKITKRAVDALKPAERERVIWDDDVTGFGIRVHPSGRKVLGATAEENCRSQGKTSASVGTEPWLYPGPRLQEEAGHLYG